MFKKYNEIVSWYDMEITKFINQLILFNKNILFYKF